MALRSKLASITLEIATGIMALYTSICAVQMAVYMTAGLACLAVGSDSHNMLCSRSGDPHVLAMLWSFLAFVVFVAYLISVRRGRLKGRYLPRVAVCVVLLGLAYLSIEPAHSLFLKLEARKKALDPKIRSSLSVVGEKSVRRGSEVSLELVVENIDSRVLELRERRGCFGFASEIRGKESKFIGGRFGECTSDLESILLKPGEIFKDTRRYHVAKDKELGPLKIWESVRAIYDGRLGSSPVSVELLVVE